MCSTHSVATIIFALPVSSTTSPTLTSMAVAVLSASPGSIKMGSKVGRSFRSVWPSLRRKAFPSSIKSLMATCTTPAPCEIWYAIRQLPTGKRPLHLRSRYSFETQHQRYQRLTMGHSVRRIPQSRFKTILAPLGQAAALAPIPQPSPGGIQRLLHSPAALPNQWSSRNTGSLFQPAAPARDPGVAARRDRLRPETAGPRQSHQTRVVSLLRYPRSLTSG